MMARMMPIRLDGQVSSLARCNKDGWVHLGIRMGTIWSDCRSKAGVVVCHLVVGFTSIEADGCPGVGAVACNSVVDFLVTEADGSCPEAGDFWCHSVVDLGFVSALPDTYAYTLRGVASHQVVGGFVVLAGSLGLCCLLVGGIVAACIFVQLIPSNSNVVMGGGCAQCRRDSGGDFLGLLRSKGLGG